MTNVPVQNLSCHLADPHGGSPEGRDEVLQMEIGMGGLAESAEFAVMFFFFVFVVWYVW